MRHSAGAVIAASLASANVNAETTMASGIVGASSLRAGEQQPTGERSVPIAESEKDEGKKDEKKEGEKEACPACGMG